MLAADGAGGDVDGMFRCFGVVSDILGQRTHQFESGAQALGLAIGAQVDVDLVHGDGVWFSGEVVLKPVEVGAFATGSHILRDVRRAVEGLETGCGLGARSTRLSLDGH